jgi:hypothetical protein
MVGARLLLEGVSHMGPCVPDAGRSFAPGGHKGAWPFGHPDATPAGTTTKVST